MNNSSQRKPSALLGALVLGLGLAACSGSKSAPQTAENAENLPPNAADIHQEDMKEAEKVAEERREEAAEEATQDVDNASVIKTDKDALTTDEVDTDPND